jgi:hypothetical protein
MEPVRAVKRKRTNDQEDDNSFDESMPLDNLGFDPSLSFSGLAHVPSAIEASPGDIRRHTRRQQKPDGVLVERSESSGRRTHLTAAHELTQVLIDRPELTLASHNLHPTVRGTVLIEKRQFVLVAVLFLCV